ncbi:MAG: hypothetical protein NC206_07675 [Bacteroides sp.]|nr:hypothetical protein [Roseburia sp.]MCM1346949.1 hypothetical protein [Bacteroides sp.]MCM1421506.1 hypothetical protein [Bacteroides sp.]
MLFCWKNVCNSNQQKFYFKYIGGRKVMALRRFSMVGYTKIDLGIVKLHFEIGAGPKPVEWVGEG